MKRILLCLFAFLLALCACETPELPSSAPTELDPIALYTPEQIAQQTTLVGGMPTEPNADALAQALDARIQAILAAMQIPVNEPATAVGSVYVRYLGVLQEPLTPREELEGVLEPTVRGEAMLPVSADPDALVGAEAGDTDLPLNTLDPDIFSLDAYRGHTILFHVQILTVYRQPKDLTEANAYLSSNDQSPIHADAIRAEERAKLLWQAALARVQISPAPEDPTCVRIAEEYVESYRNRYLATGTDLSFSKWLSLHTSYQSEAELTDASTAAASSISRSLLAACAVLDACGGREALPDYVTGCAPFATVAGYASVRFYTWQIGGSAVGWQRIIEAHCISILSNNMA